MKICSNCGKEFKNWIEVNGKLRNVQNRKFCVECSPFGAHNTRTTPIAFGECEVCGTLLTGNQTKFCSKKCNQSTVNWKTQNYECQKARGTEKRNYLLKLKGGECSRCGYKKCSSALVFHHLNPPIKDFQLDIRHCANNSLKKLMAEAEKCILLCANCHCEEHWSD